jgi:hypothetical protein
MKFVLMVPLRRCGSNAIRVRMNLHPDFYSPYPLHLCDLPQKEYSHDEAGHFQMVVDLVLLQRHSLVPWEGAVFDPIEIYKSVRNKPQSFYQIYWEMLSRIGKQHNVRVVMDKSQDSVCDFEELVRLFPDILFLDVVRDPRAQVSSMNDAIIYDFDTRLNTKRWVEARKWSDRIRETYPNKIMTIRYEDFIMKHEETMRIICDFMGIVFDPIILDVKKSREAFQMSQTSPLWETNYDQPIPQYIHKFLNNLSPLEIEAIETETLEWMLRYNYTPMTPHKATFYCGLNTIKNEMNRMEEKKKKVWEALKLKYPFDYVLRKTRSRFLGSLKKNV